MDDNDNLEDTHFPKYWSKNPEIKSLAYELEDVFTIEEIKSEVACWRIFKDYFQEQPSYVTKQNYFNRIVGLCLAYPKEPKLLIKFRNTGLRRLNMLLHSTKKEVKSRDLKLLIWCCLSLLSFFYSKRQKEGCTCFKRQKLDQCKTLFLTALYMVLPEKQEEVIKHTIKYITITSQWNVDDYDSFIFQEMFSIISKSELLVAKIIKQVEKSQKAEAHKEAFDISCTLSNILENAHWDKYLYNHLLHNCLNTLLKVFLLCSSPMRSTLKMENLKLRMSIKICIKNFVTNIKDNKGLVSVFDSIAKCLQDPTESMEDKREIMEILMFCAQKHQTKFYRESITPDLLHLLLTNLHSNEQIMAMSSHKVIQHIMDRHGNEKSFNEPVYFFKGRVNFVVNFDFSIEDIHFFKNFSQSFFEGIHHCFLTFTEKYCLILSYTTLCVVLVEVPEPVVTINVIHTLVTIQNDVLESDDLSMTVKAQIHAIISALFSLICAIHQDEVNPFKKYVEEVVKFRTENSPHLLPPLQNKYTVASYHTVEYHYELYFMEEEVLYALQRCWLGKRFTANS